MFKTYRIKAEPHPVRFIHYQLNHIYLVLKLISHFIPLYPSPLQTPQTPTNLQNNAVERLYIPHQKNKIPFFTPKFQF